MKRHEYVARNLKAEMVRRGIGATEMADHLDLSLSTFYRRLRKPWEFTLQNLDSAAAFLGLPIETLLMKGA